MSKKHLPRSKQYINNHKYKYNPMLNHQKNNIYSLTILTKTCEYYYLLFIFKHFLTMILISQAQYKETN